jgi:very-short-patch-repair endonuclease
MGIRLTQEQFENKVKEINPNLKIISKYKNMISPITYKCKICGYEETITPSASIYQGHTGCGCCSGRKLVKGVNDFGTLYPQLKVYFLSEEESHNYSKCSNKSILMKCPICGNIRNYSPNYLTNKGFSCPKCGDGYSYPNRFMYNMLMQLKIDFIREESFDWSERKIYDFIVEDNIIEMDGKFHIIDNHMNGKSKEQIKEEDIYKENLAKINGFNVIRIPCYKSDFLYIKNNILNSELYNILRLDNFDWVSLENKLINSNLVKEASDLFNLNKYSIEEIANIMNIRITKLCPLLKTSSRIGLTNYDPIKSRNGEYTPKELKQSQSKEVICLDTNTIFKSAKEAELFYGFKKDNVGRVCRGERLTIHGLRFDFVETTEEIQELKREMIKNKSKASHNTKRVMCNELNKIFESASEASRYLGHSNGYVSDIIIKNKKSDKGYTFKYI